ncbi:hypothetical protein [Moraxella sp. ZY200743]|uniref:hypothetical protein n=1 Tax=Moraxella sp. ZY200743 TaxID=2911970 RepID=UPI003D7C6DB2
MKFQIPEILWVTQKEKGFDGHCRVTHISKNAFIEYAIQVEAGLFYCYYGGRFKEFNSLENAKKWVQEVHYPAQVAKYFKVAA